MSVKQFITLENLSLYDSLIKQVISDGDAKAIKAAALNGKKLELYTIENPTAQDQPRFSITLPFTQQEIITANGRSLVWNEASGGGAKFEHNDGTWSFVGVNDGGENGLAAQIYALKKNESDKYVGTRINVTKNGIYYTNGADSMAYTAGDEIATKKDVQGDAESKTVYVVETSGSSGDQFSKKYGIYQGAQGSAQSPVPAELLSEIFIPKDMFVESGSVGTVTVDDQPYPGARVGDKYIDIILANSASEHIYIPANSLVDIYTTEQGATEIQLTISGNNVISAAVVAIHGSKLVDASVTRAKLASDVTDSLDLADTALQDDDIDSVADEDIEALFNN